jgi:hypothetical protein
MTHFELEPQDPKRKAFIEQQSNIESTLEQLRTAIAEADSVADMEDVIFDHSENQALINHYCLTRFAWLQEYNVADIAAYPEIDPNTGFLLNDAGELSTSHISHFDDIAHDAEFLQAIREDLLRIATGE